MPESILWTRGFAYRYPESAAPALEELSLQVQPGEFVVLAGRSGSGKSTLLRAACGLVPHFHGGEVAGELEVGGLSLRENGPSELAAVCGTVFQEPESQVVMGGVRAEIALPLEHRGEPPAAIARAVEETALALGIGDLLDRRTETLSGGELQRVALAAALVTRPQLLVLDEPTSQLDPVAGDELIGLLRRLNEEWGTAVLIAEHRLERCLPAADRVLALERGRLACDAPPAAFLDWALGSAPELATPLARLFRLSGLGPVPVSVKSARARLRAAGLSEQPHRAGRPAAEPHTGGRPTAKLRRAGGALGHLRPGRRPRPAAALRLRGLWYELPEGAALLRGIDLALEPGVPVALMGRNGAGKTTLLSLARGLTEPTRGRVERAGAVALLVQSPADLLVRRRAGDEAGPDGLAAAGLAGRAEANPRDLSGGERQRLALEVVLAGAGRPAAVLLDEPTRGLDPGHRRALAARLRALAADGAAVLVATHDTEFAAEAADRVVLMGRGEIVADGPAGEVLAGGRYFATEVARALDGACGALHPEAGAQVVRRRLNAEEVVA